MAPDAGSNFIDHTIPSNTVFMGVFKFLIVLEKGFGTTKTHRDDTEKLTYIFYYFINGF